MTTLLLNDVVNVTVEVSPVAAVRSGFNLGLIIGNSSVISTADRIKIYTGLSAMIADGFLSSDPEYMAAQLYFSQLPKPTRVAIGCWNDAAEGGETALTAVTDCRIKNTDWYVCTVCGASEADIVNIAAYIEAAEPKSAYFYTTDSAAVLTGIALTVGHETGAADPSTDISAGSATTFKIAVDGDVSDSPSYQSITLTVTGLNTGALIAAAMQTAIRAKSGSYAGVTVAFTGGIYVITSGITGVRSKVRVAVGTANDVAAVLKIGAANAAVDTDGVGSIMLELQGKEYRRSLGQYSTETDAVAAIIGYAMGANTGTTNSAYTLAYKSEVGITAEVLTAAEVIVIKGQNGNVYINRGGTYNLFEQGIMADGTHFDEVIGLDMLVNDIQLAVLDLLTGVRKVPQTEDGVTMLVETITGPCEDAQDRGFIAPGVWNAADILSLTRGTMLSQGYLILSESINSQSEADRSSRIAPPIYVAVKLAGAIEFAIIEILVNR